ncbi:unnamed protein product [Gadus morhua 'NCC']
MSSRENSWEFTVQRAAVWCLVFHIPTVWYFYELQETICTLKEENLHLQHRLENISWVIRDLKHLLLDHFKGYDAWQDHHVYWMAFGHEEGKEGCPPQRPVGPLSRHCHPSTCSSEPCSSPHRCEWALDTHTPVFWPWVPYPCLPSLSITTVSNLAPSPAPPFPPARPFA